MYGTPNCPTSNRCPIRQSNREKRKIEGTDYRATHSMSTITPEKYTTHYKTARQDQKRMKEAERKENN